MDLNAKDKARLQKAIEGRNSEQGFVLGTTSDYKALADAGYVQFNETIKEGKSIAIRASDEGVAAFNALSGGGAQTQAPVGEVATTTGTAAFKITKAVPVPTVRRRVGDSASKYPFDALEVGDSFHVPPTEAMPNPAKSLASSVTAANLRFATKVPGQHLSRKKTMVDNYELTRKFIIRAVDEKDPEGKGARIWRVEVSAGEGSTDEATDAAEAAE